MINHKSKSFLKRGKLMTKQLENKTIKAQLSQLLDFQNAEKENWTNKAQVFYKLL